MKKFTYMLAGASLLAIAGGVSAEPMTLSATQMDGVNAGGIYIPQGAAVSDAGAQALSNLLGLTASNTEVVVDPQGGFVGSLGESASVAVSSFSTAPGAPNGAVAVSASASGSQLF